MSDYMWLPLAILGGIIGFFFVLTVAAGLWEKRPIQPYYVPAEGEEFDPSPEAKWANLEAAACSYRHGGLCPDGKGKMYKVRYDFWIAPDSSAIAIVGSGTIANMQINGASLYSCLADGSVLSTTNSVGD